MSTPRTPRPADPDKRPYGMVRLSAPVAVQERTPRREPPRGNGGSGAWRWYGLRVPLPLLTMDGLRADS